MLRFLRSDVEAVAAPFVNTVGAMEVATMLGVSISNIDQWIGRGLLPAEKRGSRYRVNRDDLRRFCESLCAVRTELLETDEAARVLGTTPPKIVELARSGRFEYIKYGQIYLLRRDQVEDAAALPDVEYVSAK